MAGVALNCNDTCSIPTRIMEPALRVNRGGEYDAVYAGTDSQERTGGKSGMSGEFYLEDGGIISCRNAWNVLPNYMEPQDTQTPSAGNENQIDEMFIHSLLRQSTSTCFGHICSPSSGGILCVYSNW